MRDKFASLSFLAVTIAGILLLCSGLLLLALTSPLVADGEDLRTPLPLIHLRKNNLARLLAQAR